MRESEAEDSFHNLYRTVIDLLATLPSGLTIPAIISPSRQFTDIGSRLTTHVTRNSWLLLQNCIHQLAALTEIEDCLKCLLADGLLHEPVTRNDVGELVSAPHLVKQALISQVLLILARGMDRVGRVQLTHQDIHNLFVELKNKKTASQGERSITVPLKNFRMGPEPFFVECIELSVFSAKEKNALWSIGSLDYTISVEEFQQMRFKLLGRYDAFSKNPENRFRVENLIGCFIDTLRLLKDGDVGAIWSFEHGEQIPGSAEEFGSAELTDYHAKNYGDTYAFTESDYPQFQRLFQSVRTAKQSGALKPLEVSLRRFNQSYGRKNEEDKLIDLTIALENTLLADLKEELKYRLTLRGAALLCKSRVPFEVKMLLNAIYEARSKIVHQGLRFTDRAIQKIIEKPCAALHFLNFSEEIVRQVLREYILKLGLGKTVQEINQDLDILIVNSLAAK
jgi:hypothetical protein